jgi:transcription-repair coupling factor (superfamily II helicase)
MDLLSNFQGVAAPAPRTGESLICINSLRSFVIAKATSENPILVVAPSSRTADEIADELRSYLGDVVINFPAWETLPHERLSPKSDTVTARISALHKINSNSGVKVVVTSVRGALQPIVSDILQEELIKLVAGKKISMAELTKRLSYFGFTRTDLVEKRGDFAVRGGILDFFAPDLEHPIRIDFFGDEIEEMQFFQVADQRTYADVKNEVFIYPGREILISDEVRAKAKYLMAEFPQLAEMAGKISEGISVEGMESIAALLKPSFSNILNFLPNDYQVVAIDQPRLQSRASDLVLTNEEFLEASWSSAAIGGAVPIDLTGAISSGGYCTFEELKELATTLKLSFWSIDPYAQSPDELTAANELADFEAIPIYEGNIESAIADISNWLVSGYNLTFSASGAGILERYQVLFREAQISGAKFTTSSIEHGFINHSAKLALITEKDISGQRTSSKDQARMPSRRKKAIDPLELKPGDYVVHEQHGVGKYIELINRTVANVSREYLVIEYAASKRGQPADRLFVPTDTLEQITRYVGGEAPAVNRIGGSDWQNTKRRARKAVKQIAAELIQLYAARMSAPGYAFSPDTAWQRELEAAFAYVETTDQLATIEEVKVDMEKSYPMDRVVCGDVGYGKTEIAVRAAFKAVQDGKQVAVLVPTTLLVQQHLTTFNNRYTGFPIKVAGLSRFNTPKEGRKILEGMKSGSIDVVIGTLSLIHI